ncbi:MAG: tRNA (guanosine(46)-N7)-methyltransferase TrmB [Candidatus Magasanikbacteria bacterium CG11_big_fil_rev_8_21_14_0_20_39_34]|uniref:tRNA (guanine-N(7)-)-methyltransferase n=1 Tax=Candidatus Magasanikbacteria bacterium CG11_big_fil_rev_8_21_14_0_20_39_34 TaxID=1974653 RepID=A0A2H0N6J9_9BACT|nr:MAG: tRNA (guanosine(46)-N7)-methyltransferase TrmB [Candidatus Magasanikbacteria bacterium CG11_big_fil_rev_8_21_14_0_20_39_34]
MQQQIYLLFFGITITIFASMGKKRDKTSRYSALHHMENVFDYKYSASLPQKGNWFSLFGNNNPIVLELACGKGDYTLKLAKKYPEKNFIAMDIKGARIYIGAKEAQQRGLKNVFFLRAYIDHLEEYFHHGEIHEIWIPFPDPHPTEKGQKKRLTSLKFLNQYKRVLRPKGIVNLKTDSELLFDYTLEMLDQEHITPKQILFNMDLNSALDSEQEELLAIQTYYEKQHRLQKKKIHFLSFSF